MSLTESLISLAGSPFDPENRSGYERWRAGKLSDYPDRAERLMVEIADPRSLTRAEHEQMLTVCRKANMAIYACGANLPADKDIPLSIGRQFGLERLDSNLLADEDAVTSITCMPEKSGRGYIPYTNRRLLWHTDGYYNSPENRVRAFVLHCVTPAAEGGENALMDPEIAYILLRDENPEFIRSFMAPDAMTIPANEESGMRGAQTGPVFSIDPLSGCLHMRYTARSRSIVWKDSEATRAAVQSLERLLNGDSPYVFRHRLASGQGLMCNNVLHNRTAFTDAVDTGAARLIYRARFHDRIRGTELIDITGTD